MLQPTLYPLSLTDALNARGCNTDEISSDALLLATWRENEKSLGVSRWWGPSPPSSPSPSPSPATDAEKNSPSSHRAKCSKTLENMGFCVGRRVLDRINVTGHTLNSNMSVMRYICTQFWPMAFDHPMAGLKSNHRGVFILTDSAFKMIDAIGPMATTMNLKKERSQAVENVIQSYLALPLGILRGALETLMGKKNGQKFVVKVDCKFDWAPPAFTKTKFTNRQEYLKHQRGLIGKEVPSVKSMCAVEFTVVCSGA